MPNSAMSVWSISGAILASLGGGALIVAALFRFLAEITAKRILQSEQNAVLVSLEGLKQELGLARLTYDKHVEHVVDYYALFYRHYQLCQTTEHADILRWPDRPDVNTKEDFLNKIDSFAAEWNSRQGLLRLILPKTSLEIHERMIAALNDFKNKVMDFDNSDASTRVALHDSLVVVDSLKKELEISLRDHLRTDKI